MGEVVYRSYRHGDEDSILELFREVFGDARGAARWTWQFGPGSVGHVDAIPPVIALAALDGVCIGHFGVMRQDLSHYGRRIAAGQACDAMVRAAHRGQGMVVRLSERAMAEAASAGLAAVLGFGSLNTWPSSLVPALRHGGFSKIGTLHHYYLRLGAWRAGAGWGGRLVSDALRSRRRIEWQLGRRARGAGLTTEVSTRLPDDVEPLLSRAASYDTYGVWKDSAYLRWRYEQHPEHRYLFHTLREHGSPEALAVTRRNGPSTVICELIHSHRDIQQAAFLLRTLAVLPSSDPPSASLEFLGLDGGFFDAAFAAAGFVVRPFSTLVAVCRPAGLATDALTAPHNWSLSYGDTDVV